MASVRRGLISCLLTGCQFSAAAAVDTDASGGSSGDETAVATSTTPDPGSTTGGDDPDSSDGDPTTTTGSTACASDWANPNWHYRTVLTLDNDSMDAVVGATIPVFLEPVRFFYEGATADGHDLRFVANDEELPWDIEQWQPGGASVVWIRAPDLAPLATVEITLYYGNPDAPPSAVNVPLYVDEVVGVWRFDDAGGALVENAARDMFDGTAAGMTVQIPDGRVGSARRFVDPDDAIDLPAESSALLDGWGAFTISTWIRPEYAADPDWDAAQGWFLDKGGSVQDGRTFRAGGSAPNTGQVQVDFFFANGSTSFQPLDLPRGQWSHLTWTFDGTTLSQYVDGQVAASTAYGPTTLAASANPVRLGRPGSSFLGSLDEFRIESAARSDTWIALQYAAMADQLLAFGPTETCGST